LAPLRSQRTRNIADPGPLGWDLKVAPAAGQPQIDTTTPQAGGSMTDRTAL